MEIPRRDRVPLGARLRGNRAGLLVHAALADTGRGSAAHRAAAPVGMTFAMQRRINRVVAILRYALREFDPSPGPSPRIVGPCQPTKIWTRSRPAISSRWRCIG